MKKNVWLATKGPCIADCLRAMGAELERLHSQEVPGYTWAIHSFQFHTTLEMPGKLAMSTHQPGPVAVVNMVALVLEEKESLVPAGQDVQRFRELYPHLKITAGMPTPEEITPGLEKQLAYAHSFMCKHNVEGVKIQSDEDGFYQVCRICDSRVRIELEQ